MNYREEKRKTIIKNFLKFKPAERIDIMEHLMHEHIRIKVRQTGKTDYEIYKEYIRVSQKKDSKVF